MAYLDDLPQRFKRFAEQECRGSSSLYERLSLGIAADPEILGIASHARKGQPVPNLFLGATHLLLLKGARHPVSAFFPSVSNASAPDEDPYPYFREFCIQHGRQIIELISTRLVQTNVVRRCACLLPAFSIVAERTRGLPMSLVEIGTSAGLNLLWDRYGYDYGEGWRYGDASSVVQLTCDTRGVALPPISEPFPDIALRVGIDLNPIDLSDPEAILWLRALIWPEHRGRVETLKAAIEIARRNPPKLLAGDALDLLSEILNSAPDDSALCVFHTHTVNQFSDEAKERLSAMLDKHGSERDLFVISIEAQRGIDGALVELVAYENGKKTRRALAHSDAHGRWLEWL